MIMDGNVYREKFNLPIALISYKISLGMLLGGIKRLHNVSIGLDITA